MKKLNKNNKNLYFYNTLSSDILICKCNSNEHHIIIKKEDNMVFAHIYLNNYKNFWKRLIVALKYICGYQCKYGHWDEFIFSSKHADKLYEIADILSKGKDK